ncbi:MAG: 2-oxoisovalerate dehydrogenase [Deltaproteobacteria bacterium GWB2_55_19]|nr:MAG: 2-oxoisovalerate dehydrogenase [Deltaproteobacteria bacterium GWB2_55_19]HAO94206.1 alpha-ketoacid dehydrogenase subunit beta [Deltaproteobacteria bacterium]
MGKLNIVGAINSALFEEMGRDSDVIIIGEDVGRDGGVFRVTEGLLERFGPDRVIDTPLSELGIIGAAVGLAAYGMKPVAEIQFMGFLYAGLEQIFSHAARIRSRSRGRFSVPMVIRTPYGIGIKPPELHSESSEALFCHMPGIKVVVPSTPYNAKGLLKSAIRDPDTVLFMEPSRLYRSIKADVPDGDYVVPLGRASILQEGKDLTVVSWGTMLHKAAEAAEGFDAEIIDLMTLKPFDEEAILTSVKKTGRLVIVHEAPRIAGFGAEVAALVAEEAIEYLKAPILRVAGFEAVVPMARLEDFYMPSLERIKKAYERVMRY